MRQSSGRRPPRGGGRHHSNSGNGNRGPRGVSSLRHQNFDSNGPDVRVRGNAKQVHEKYLSLARDARGSGDYVLAENLMQHAEHYYRITQAINEAAAAEQRKRDPQGAQGTAPQAEASHSGSAPQAAAPAPKGDDEQPKMPDNYYTPEGKLPEAPVAAAEKKPARRGRPPRTKPVAETADPFMPKDADAPKADAPKKAASGE